MLKPKPNFYSIKKIDSYVVVFCNVSVYCLCLCPKKTGIFLGIAWKLAKTSWQGLSPSKPIEYLFSRKVVSMTWLIESIWVSWCCCYCWCGRAAASCLCAKLEYASHQYSKQTQSYNLALLLFCSLPFVYIFLFQKWIIEASVCTACEEESLCIDIIAWGST